MPIVSPLAQILLGLAVVAAGMVGLWVVQRRTRNAAIVDVGWTVAVGLLGTAYAILGSGAWERRLLVGGMVALWSGRLAWHLIERIRGEPEEGRYQRLRRGAGLRP